MKHYRILKTTVDKDGIVICGGNAEYYQDLLTAKEEMDWSTARIEKMYNTFVAERKGEKAPHYGEHFELKLQNCKDAVLDKWETIREYEKTIA